MKTDPISRKQAIRRLGGLVVGSGLLPQVPFSAAARPSAGESAGAGIRNPARSRQPHIILIMDGKSLMSLVTDTGTPWRPYIGMEHATTYWKNNYWAAVTDGKFKYIWYFRTGQQQFFNLQTDPGETADLATGKEETVELQQWRDYLIDYLRERGPEFVKDGKLVKRTKNLLYGPLYPHSAEESGEDLRYWQQQEKAGYFLCKAPTGHP